MVCYFYLMYLRYFWSKSFHHWFSVSSSHILFHYWRVSVTEHLHLVIAGLHLWNQTRLQWIENHNRTGNQTKQERDRQLRFVICALALFYESNAQKKLSSNHVQQSSAFHVITSAKSFLVHFYQRSDLYFSNRWRVEGNVTTMDKL